ncbi:APC family permease [Alicyclobacillus fastidiosus]|uniref:APC family permease n=1 Tax=Alicyclobacillus fastidiosus TaxID=392011 RepID=A0ABY6ZCK3_9BACL|nr:APC family permease [Alicyclobacillus fastidiosus]WAH40591.1 APC family permease [Alicyclobacillus fastidiosus]GMA62027.1 amino acid permease [Alicyclobacillus fastidiosus]
MGNLKKDSLSLVETVALSAAVMAPSVSMALNVSLITGLAGYSVTIIFLISVVITFCVSATIIKFNQMFSTSGSLYKFTEYGLGKKVALVSGWALFLAYFTLVVGVSAALGSYLSSLLSTLHIHVNWLPISLFLSLVMWVLAYRDMNVSTRVMLALEGVSISLILILAGVIFFKTGLHGLSWAPLGFGSNNFSAIAQGVVMGLLSFAGFECASALGEETRNPKKMIPLVICGTIAGIAIFFLISSYSQVIGYGVTTKGIKALSNSAMPLSNLADKFVSKQYAFLVVLAITMSLFSCVIGCVCTGSRILLSMSRDGNLHKSLSNIHVRFKTPHVSVNTMMIASLLIQISFYIFTRGDGKDLYDDSAYVTALSMLVAYMFVNASGIVYFYKNKIWKMYQLIIPAVAIVAMLYTAYSNIYPVPPYPMNLAPYITIGFIIAMLIVSRITKHDANLQNIDHIEQEMGYGPYD